MRKYYLQRNPQRLQRVSFYRPNNEDKIRKYYLQRNPCQPLQQEFE